MDSPDQGVKGIPTSSITFSGDSLTISVKAIGGAFEGRIGADPDAIDGTWKQGAGTYPLLLKRVKNQSEAAPRRPQDPVKPYPYREEAVSYSGKVQSNTLAGTLTIPPGKGPFPAILLIVGSGPNDRDESLLGHRPFLVLSDYLTRKGIVVLRFDKRGVGKSTGEYATATTENFADDALAGDCKELSSSKPAG